MSTLTPERWLEVSPYLDHVLSLPEADRATWLNSFQAEKPELAELLKSLVEENKLAVLWRRLLVLGARHPDSLGRLGAGRLQRGRPA